MLLEEELTEFGIEIKIPNSDLVRNMGLVRQYVEAEGFEVCEIGDGSEENIDHEQRIQAGNGGINIEIIDPQYKPHINLNDVYRSKLRVGRIVVSGDGINIRPFSLIEEDHPIFCEGLRKKYNSSRIGQRDSLAENFLEYLEGQKVNYQWN